MNSWKESRILITGITGFVGSHLAKRMLREGAEVFGMVRKRADGMTFKNLKDRKISNEVKLLEGDLRDISSIGKLLDATSPDYLFHLGAQSFIPLSFKNPLETMKINCVGTTNILEAVRMKSHDPRIVFAGSSEEYGLVIGADKQYARLKDKYGHVFPEPNKIPEVPISEDNPLRPRSPYAVSKVFGEQISRNYHESYGLKTLTPRFFNTEGEGRGPMFVTSVVTSQAMKLKNEEIDEIQIGNVNAFRDWSHIDDSVEGYLLISQKGKFGIPYNIGSMRTNSVLTYILLSLEHLGYKIDSITTENNKVDVKSPTELNNNKCFGVSFEKTKVDELLLSEDLQFSAGDLILINTDKGTLKARLHKDRFRPAEVPILLADTQKIKGLGFSPKKGISDIIKDQLNYYMEPKNREDVVSELVFEPFLKHQDKDEM